ncbi:hypothetical protein QBC37DRAFT_97616 [Rhypophila decipiens]|uniref:Uncharacterized protein n=1 Tax=Rhypophila decipiens TaxID=261697 RepID=A0AAN7B841_9PEZI|nr:hypothetical protein QBC37DRAFT_97616 [Rhypophila decipiens]
MVKTLDGDKKVLNLRVAGFENFCHLRNPEPSETVASQRFLILVHLISHSFFYPALLAPKRAATVHYYDETWQHRCTGGPLTGHHCVTHRFSLESSFVWSPRAHRHYFGISFRGGNHCSALLWAQKYSSTIADDLRSRVLIRWCPRRRFLTTFEPQTFGLYRTSTTYTVHNILSCQPSAHLPSNHPWALIRRLIGLPIFSPAL